MPPEPRRNHIIEAQMMGEDPLALVWAVSYADLLLVMLTFFVIFYDYSTSFQASPVEQIVLDLKSKMNAKNLSESTDRKPGSVSSGLSFVSLDSLRKGLDGKGVKGASDPDFRNGIVVNLSDSLYGSAQFDLSAKARAELDQLFVLLRPQKKVISLTFVGHADDSPVVKVGGNVIDSNLVLSNLRAARAVQYAVDQGFDPHWVSALGVGEFRRNSRSLSVQIVERSAP